MPAVKKATADKKSVYGNVIVSDKVKDHGDDPICCKESRKSQIVYREKWIEWFTWI